MTIWIHGSGAGAHVLAWKFAESRLCSEIICTPGNAGTQTLCITAPPPGCIPDLNIPQTQLLYRSVFQIPENGCTDLCVLSDGKKQYSLPPVYIQAAGIKLSCALNADTDVRKISRYYICEYMEYCREPGIYTFRFADGRSEPLRIYRGLPDASACAVLPCLQSDLVRIFQMMASGFPETFELRLREGCVAVSRLDGQPGACLENLAALPGDIGVFLHQMENAGDTLRFTGPHGLFLCAKEKNISLAQEKVMAAVRLLQAPFLNSCI